MPPRPSASPRAIASAADAPASDLFTSQERMEIYSAAYDAAFDSSIAKNITKKTSKLHAYVNYAICNAPADGAKAGVKAIKAAIKLKTAHLKKKKQTPFDIKRLVAEHALKAATVKALRLMLVDDNERFEMVKAIGLRSMFDDWR